MGDAPPVERWLARGDAAWAWIVSVYGRHPVAFVLVTAGVGFVARLAATPFSMPVITDDAIVYTVKALEIARGDWTPVRSHAIGWSAVLAPFVWLVRDAPLTTALAVSRVVACAIGALIVVPLAVVARQTLDEHARPLAVLLGPFALLLIRGSVRGLPEPLLAVALTAALAGALATSRTAHVVGGVAAGLACFVHPTGMAVPFIAAVAVLATRRGRRVEGAVTVVVIALVVAAPAAAHRAATFDGPLDYGFNSPFVVARPADAWGTEATQPTLQEYLFRRPAAKPLWDALVVRGAAGMLWTFATDVVHAPVAPFVVVGAWIAARVWPLRAVLAAVGLFMLSWVPVFAEYGNGRHLSPALPLALVLMAAGVAGLTRARRHGGALVLAAVVAYATGEFTTALVQRHRLASDAEAQSGVEWAGWVARNVRGRLALAAGHAFVMMHLDDTRVGGATLFTMHAPRTGLALVRLGHFEAVTEALTWMRAQGVTHVLVDRAYSPRTFGPWFDSPATAPPMLVERFANAPDSPWPVRIYEIRWDRATTAWAGGS